MKKLMRIASMVALSVVLLACGGQSGTTQDEDLFGEYGGGEQGAATSGTGDEGLQQGNTFGEGEAAAGSAASGPAASLENRLVYFGFDQSEVATDYLDMLAAHGRYLASHPDARVRLEGHTDERGSREYNIGLGERRAQAVRQILLLQGAAANQLSTVSYGEERPAVLGSDEEAWSLNRRVELVYVR